MSSSSSTRSNVPLPAQRVSQKVNIATDGGMAGTGSMSFNGIGLSGAEQVKMLERLLVGQHEREEQKERNERNDQESSYNVATDGGLAGQGALHIDTTNMTNEEQLKACEAALEYQANNSNQEQSGSCYANGPNSMAGDYTIRIGPFQHKK